MKHKLDLEMKIPQTRCGIKVIAYYPLSNEGLAADFDKDRIGCFIKWVTDIDCPDCIKKMLV